MAYVISAFVARIPTLEAIAQRYQNAVVVPLAQGFGLIPITHALRQEIHADDAARLYEFYEFTEPIQKIAVNASPLSSIAYIEAEFFGGDGTQAGIVWQQGQVIFEPLLSEEIGVIDQVLRTLGVQVGADHDEFDALGLGKYRDTEDWLKDIPN
jgi:hypothetical protein